MRGIALCATAGILIFSLTMAYGKGAEPVVGMALASGKPVILDLGAGYCDSCKKMKSVLASLEKEYRGRVHTVVIDVNEEPELASKYRVQLIPTQVFFDARGKEVKRHIGFMDKAEIVKELKALGVK